LRIIVLHLPFNSILSLYKLVPPTSLLCFFIHAAFLCLFPHQAPPSWFGFHRYSFHNRTVLMFLSFTQPLSCWSLFPYQSLFVPQSCSILSLPLMPTLFPFRQAIMSPRSSLPATITRRQVLLTCGG